jgi:hypothetical protein
MGTDIIVVIIFIINFEPYSFVLGLFSTIQNFCFYQKARKRMSTYIVILHNDELLMAMREDFYDFTK